MTPIASSQRPALLLYIIHYFAPRITIHNVNTHDRCFFKGTTTINKSGSSKRRRSRFRSKSEIPTRPDVRGRGRGEENSQHLCLYRATIESYLYCSSLSSFWKKKKLVVSTKEETWRKSAQFLESIVRRGCQRRERSSTFRRFGHHQGTPPIKQGVN